MPEPLSSEDVEKEIDSAIKAADAKSMKDMGTVMNRSQIKSVRQSEYGRSLSKN